LINRLVEALAAAGRRAFSYVWRHRRLRPALRWLRRHLPESIAVLSLVALVTVVHPSQLASVFGRMDWRVALLMVPVVLTSYLLRGFAWWVALRCVGVRLSMPRTLTVELAGQLMVTLPLGDLSRVAMARKLAQGKGVGHLTGTIAFQELTFTMMLGLGILPRVATRPSIALLAVVMTLLHVAIFTVIVWKPAYHWSLRRVERIRVLRRFDRQMREVRPSVVELFDWRAFVPIMVCQAAAALLSFLLFYLGLRGLGIHISYATSTFVLALSYVIAGMSLVPGGIGPFEAILTVLLVTSGVPAAAGAAAGLLYRGYNDVLMMLVGAPFAAWIRYHHEPERRQSSRQEAKRRTSGRAAAR
jgi:uncharacterized membrane protein YbhN (UPF0104 family)